MAANRRPGTPPAIPRDRRRGADDRRTRACDRLASYARDHRRNGGESLRRLMSAPVQTGMAAMVIAIALALPAALYMGVATLHQLSDHFHSSAQISVFLHKEAHLPAIRQLIERLRALPTVKDVTYVSREEALSEFKAASGFGDALALLDDNPLPPVLLVSPQDALESDVARVAQLVDELAREPLVDGAQLDMKWLQRMEGLLAIGRQVALSVGIALALGVLLVIANTVGLAIESRRDEVLVVKLVGGTNAFVRRPFLYTGCWYGMLGGIAAWFGLALGEAWLADAVSRLGHLYQSQFALAELGAKGLLLPLAGATLGLLGAWLAVGRHLANIEPH